MRIAVLILGIFGSIVVIIQGLVASSLLSAANEETLAGAAALGFVVGVVGLVASTLVIAFPLATSIIFVICGLVGYGAAAGGFSDMWLHGSAYLVLAVLAYFGWRGKRKGDHEVRAEKERQLARDARLDSLLSQQQASAGAAVSPDARCPRCGKVNVRGSSFCSSCGAPLVPVPVAVASPTSNPQASTPSSFFDGIAENRPK